MTIGKELKMLVKEAEEAREKQHRAEVEKWLTGKVFPHCRARAQEGETSSNAIQIPVHFTVSIIKSIVETEELTADFSTEGYMTIHW